MLRTPRKDERTGLGLLVCFFEAFPQRSNFIALSLTIFLEVADSFPTSAIKIAVHSKLLFSKCQTRLNPFEFFLAELDKMYNFSLPACFYFSLRNSPDRFDSIDDVFSEHFLATSLKA